MRRGLVSFGSKNLAAVTVEIAERPEELRKGLADRTELRPEAGMLFWEGARADHTFWGKRLLIPIDVIFIDFDRVVGILEIDPGDETHKRLGRPSSAALEVNRGWAERHGVKVGDLVRISAT